MSVAINVTQVSKHFRSDKAALSDVSLTVNKGEMVALIGASGSGKSTLLRVIAGLLKTDKASSAKVDVLGNTLQASGQLAKDVRQQRAQVGFIFQQFNLVNRLSVLLNTLMGSLGRIPKWRGLLGLFYTADKHLAMQALQRVGMEHTATQRASTLSGGQQQRVAIARALVQKPSIVLADEPIASLDPESARKVMDALADLNKEGMTVLVSLHQVDYAIRYCKRTVALKDGVVVYDGPSSELTPEKLDKLYGATSASDMYAFPSNDRPTSVSTDNTVQPLAANA